jgi:hypothetical protein
MFKKFIFLCILLSYNIVNAQGTKITGSVLIQSGATGTVSNLGGTVVNSIPYQCASGTTCYLSPSTSSTTEYLCQTDSGVPAWCAVSDGGGSGTVTSVGLTVPDWLTVTNSPITSSGTIAITGTSETANYFIAAPNGTAGAMTPRAIVAADLPSSITSSTTGTAAQVVNSLTLTNTLATPTFTTFNGSAATTVDIIDPSQTATQTMAGDLTLPNLTASGTVTAGSIGTTIYAANYCTTKGILDQSCIANALAAATANTNVIVGSGTYNFSSGVTWSTSNTTITCAPGAVFSRASSLSSSMLVLTGSYQTLDGSCALTGGSSSANAYSGLVHLSDTSYTTLRGLHIYTVGSDYGIRLDQASHVLADHLQMDSDSGGFFAYAPNSFIELNGGRYDGGYSILSGSNNGAYNTSLTNDVNIHDVSCSSSGQAAQSGNYYFSCGGVGDFTGNTTITGYSITSNAVTFTTSGTNHVTGVGTSVLVIGLSTGNYLNYPSWSGVWTVTAVGTNTFTVTSPGFAHANVSSTTDAGFANVGIITGLRIVNTTCNISGTTSTSQIFDCWTIPSYNTIGAIFSGNTANADNQFINYDVLEFGASRSEVSNNTIHAQDSGMQVYSAIHFYSGGNHVFGNHVYGWGNGSSSTASSGVTFSSHTASGGRIHADNNIITGNTVSNPLIGTDAVSCGICVSTNDSSAQSSELNTIITDNIVVGPIARSIFIDDNGYSSPLNALIQGNSISGGTIGVYYGATAATSVTLGTNYFTGVTTNYYAQGSAVASNLVMGSTVQTPAITPTNLSSSTAPVCYSTSGQPLTNVGCKIPQQSVTTNTVAAWSVYLYAVSGIYGGALYPQSGQTIVSVDYAYNVAPVGCSSYGTIYVHDVTTSTDVITVTSSGQIGSSTGLSYPLNSAHVYAIHDGGFSGCSTTPASLTVTVQLSNATGVSLRNASTVGNDGTYYGTWASTGETITQIDFGIGRAGVGCTSLWGVELYDQTSSSVVAGTTVTIANSLQQASSGSVSVALTSGHKYGWTYTSGSGCTTPPAYFNITGWILGNSSWIGEMPQTIANLTTYLQGAFTPANALSVSAVSSSGYQTPSGCSTNAVAQLYDNTASSPVSGLALTLSTQYNYNTLGALVGLTAGHQYSVQVTGGTGCTTTPKSVDYSISFSTNGPLLQGANNLSDVSSSSTARINLGLGSVSTLPSSVVSLRAGSWSISSGTSATVTFGTAMAAAPTSCGLTPSASTASTGTPFATSLATTGFTVNVPTSGTISGTYQCVITNSY